MALGYSEGASASGSSRMPIRPRALHACGSFLAGPRVHAVARCPTIRTIFPPPTPIMMENECERYPDAGSEPLGSGGTGARFAFDHIDARLFDVEEAMPRRSDRFRSVLLAQGAVIPVVVGAMIPLGALVGLAG